MFTYLWQSALVLTVLYIPFQLLLRKEHFFALNRAILLGILLLSLALPLSRHTMPLFVDNWLHPEVEMEAAPFIPLGEYQDWDGDIIIEDGDIEESTSIEIHWTDLLFALWLLGTTLFLAWYSRGLWRLYKILYDKDNTREELTDGNTLLLTSYALPSFSWMHSIVISQEDYAENGETILLHERAHIAHHHSFDRLLLLVVQAIQWWNPFVWLMADALSQVHEYQADLAVLNQGTNATQYQLLLIRKAAGPAGLALVNGFKRNKLKLRIVMMNNMIKLRGAKSRYLALLPVALLAFTLTAKAQEKTSEQEIESVKVVGMGFQKDFEIRTKGNTPDPLVLVEGEVYEDWKNIDPSIIESMTIYKEDSDTVAHYSAIYEAAKNGVIMIELQEGKKQKPYKRKTVSNEEANEQAFRDSLFASDSGRMFWLEQDEEIKASLERPNEPLIIKYIWVNENLCSPRLISEEKLKEYLANPDPDYEVERFEPGDPNITGWYLDHPNCKNGVVIVHPKWKIKTEESEKANEHAIQYIADVKAGRIKPRDNDSFMLQDLDVAPEFPNGGSFKNFINHNLRYPKSAAEKGVQGTVIVEFHIMKDGRIDYVKSFSNETNDKDLEAEAVRVVSSMPKWTPGKINGQDVNSSMYVPIIFKLNSPTEKKHTIGDMPYTEDMLFVYDGNVVNLSDIKDLVPEECGINGMSLYRDGYYVEQYIDKYPKAKNGVVMINSFMKNSALFVIDGEPMNFQTMRQKYPEGLSPIKYHINHKDAETIAKYSQYPEAKNGVNVVITGKE